MSNTTEFRNIRCKVLFEDGSEREITITAAAQAMIRKAALTMPFLFDGTGFNPLAGDAARIMAVTRADHDLLHRPWSQRKTDFRLGQMDMKASVSDMLRDAAANAMDENRRGLIRAADLVKEMEVPHADPGK